MHYTMQTELLPASINVPGGGAPRSLGVHVSHIIKGIALQNGVLKKREAEEFSLIEIASDDWWKTLAPADQLRISIGLAWEQWYIPQLGHVTDHPGEMEVDGIYMTHDGESVDMLLTPTGPRHTLCLHEVKATYKSVKTVGDLMTQWMWLAQTKAYCVSPQTRVLTSDLRWIRAADVMVGHELMAFDEMPLQKGRRWRRSTVKSVSTLLLDCYELTLKDGTEIVCSGDHQWLTLPSESVRTPKWTRTDKLLAEDSKKYGKQDHRICKILDTWEPPTSYEAGWIAGVADGEGWVSQSKEGWISLGMAQCEGAVAQQLRQYLRNNGVIFNEYDRQADGCLRFVIPRHANVFEFLGRFRPQRLLNKFGGFTSLPEVSIGKRAVGIKRRRFVGKQAVRAIETSTGTYIAEGLASHNCKGLNTLTAYLHVLFLCGAYKYPISPELRVWRITYTQAEIDENWELMLGFVRHHQLQEFEEAMKENQ